ncbi:MAG: AMP-binding protein, partial [Deltaproteobacteria bacterium]|nr:AMP-binding protein [Deltaproteobacteria bacterium]
MSKLLWKPSKERIENTSMYHFMEFVNLRLGHTFTNYHDLYTWSIEESPAFWATLWDYGEVIHSRLYDQVVDDIHKLPGARWFQGARLNFAENLLRYRDDRIALSFRGEDRPTVSITYGELYQQVARLAKSLRDVGIQPEDRIAGFMPNMIESVIAMLAATSIGATWSSCSPDFGIKGVLDRFGQIEPRILFTADGYFYNGKAFDSLDRISHITKQLPSIERVVVVPYKDPAPAFDQIRNAVLYEEFIAEDAEDLLFEQLPANHPLYIMYSSGTTGVPKCIVHGVVGTLLQHIKELKLHSDVKRQDTIFYFTTCGWMMWNWLASSLALGARVFLYDGAPFYPQPSAM